MIGRRRARRAPTDAPGARGRQPTPQAVAENPATVWQPVTIERWYSQGARQVEIASGTALWVRSGMPAVPLRSVVVRDPQGKFVPQAFLCTDEAIAPGQVLSWFVRRWQMEVTFEEAREHLGMETQRQWSDRAIARTTPVLLGLYSLVALMARQVLAQNEMPIRTACWYRKEQATFSDTIALVRRCLWAAGGFSISGKAPDMVEIPRGLFERLTDTLSYAA